MGGPTTGHFDEGKACMNAIMEPGHGDRVKARWSLVAACFCYISGETDLLTEVEAVAKDALAKPDLQPLRRSEAQAALAQVAVLRHEASTADEQYAVLRPYANAVTQTGSLTSPLNQVKLTVKHLTHKWGADS